MFGHFSIISVKGSIQRATLQRFILKAKRNRSKQIMLSGDNLEIMGKVRKLSKRSLAHENFLLIQHKFNKSEKKVFFLKIRNVLSNIYMLNKPRLRPGLITSLW